jgi:hypothetical protein
MHLQILLYRLRWFHAPAAVLMMLLQRTPVLRLVTGGTAANVGLQSGELLKSAFALAALGAYNSVAGATTFNAVAVSPTTVTPASGVANSSFTASCAQSAAFKVTFTGTGAPSTIKSWKVAGTTFPPGLSVTGGTAVTGGYTINGLSLPIAGTPTTAGSYPVTINAYDTAGATGNTAKVTCTITITSTTSAPAFTTQPTSQTITAGGNATFTSAASGTPTPTYQWYQGATLLTGQTNATLALTNVQTANAGTYSVKATNSVSTVSSNNATLTVNTAPAFTTQPATQTVTPGSNVTFTTVATGSPTPTFQWYKDNVAISGQTAATLSLTNVQAANAGSYTVLAINSVSPSGVSSSAATLTLSQTITFGVLSSKTFGDLPFTVSATASSGLTPTFSIFSGPATISGSTVTITGVGTVVVRASQAGNASFTAATAVDQSFSVAQAAQTITFGALSGKTFGDVPFTVSATASSSLTPTFSIFSGPATISGNTVTVTGAGTVVVRASQAGNASYAAATAVDQSFSVAQAAQTITFGALTGKTYGNAPFTVSATASSGLTPTFSIFSGPATISGSTVTITGVGTVVVRASQAGSSNYTAATPVDQSFSVSKATATVTLGSLSQSYTGAALSATASTTPSALTVTFTYNTSATAPTNAGSYAVVGTINDSLYQGSASGTLVISQISQTITFGALSGKTYGNAPFTVSATASSGLTPTFSIFSGPATISGSTITLTGGGTVVVRASQAGNTNYTAATPVDQSFSVAQAAQTITFGALSGKTYGDAPFTVSATASSSLTPTFSIFSGPATISGSTVTLTGAGIVIVRASQAGNANYTAATPVDQSFTVNTALQSWRQLYFGTTANTGSAADSAVTNLDGLPNLLEYALGGIPTVANSSIAPKLGTTVSNGATYLTLTFTPKASDITYAIEVSGNLGGAWTSIPLAGLLTMGNAYTYTDTIAVATGVPRFLRLRVTGQ